MFEWHQRAERNPGKDEILFRYLDCFMPSRNKKGVTTAIEQDWSNFSHGPLIIFLSSPLCQLDLWMRRDLMGSLKQLRTELGEFLNCSADELALVTNTTQGANTVIRSLDFQPGDRILQFSTGYISVDKTTEYVCDTLKDVQIVQVPVTYPISDEDLLKKVEETVEAHRQLKDGSRIRLAVVDWISSVPSILHPVQKLVEYLQGEGILVFVDGAHAIGQVPVDLTALHPDFFITNAHKV